MTAKKLVILLAIFLGGLSGVYLLPKHLGYQPMGVIMELPARLGRWTGRAEDATQHEKEVLVGAQFAYATYRTERGEPVHVRVVLAGQDMMANIHRPERCLKAQGWSQVGDGSGETIPAGEGHQLGVTRLHNSAVVESEGKPKTIENVTYYWFTGYQRQIATHWGRMLVDLMDRTFKGYNQRWAMILVSAEIIPGYRDEAQTDAQLRELTALVANQITKPDVVW